MQRSDTELMLAFKAGDGEAFRVLVERTSGQLINFFYRLTWSREVAEDLSQEVYLHIHRFRDGYEARAKFSTFLYSVARNCWRDYVRKIKRRPRTRSIEGKSEEAGLLMNMTGGEASPGAALEKQETLAEIREALQTLSEGLQLVFVLCEEKERTYAEVAEIMNIPVGTVKSRLHTAIQRLRKKLRQIAEIDNKE